MISYEVVYSEGNGRPYLAKKHTIPNSDPILMPLNIYMPDSEVSAIPTESIFSYLDSLVLYIQETSENLKTIQLDEFRGEYHWSMWGWSEINWAYSEYDTWWKYGYYSRESGE
jgi:hypothetical protein